MIERHSKVFVPVSVDERNPEIERYYHVYRNGNITPAIHFYYKDSNEWSSKTDTWLEEKENVYVLSDQELNEEKKKEAIAFLDSIRDYELENKQGVYLDERTSEEFYELFNQQK